MKIIIALLIGIMSLGYSPVSANPNNKEDLQISKAQQLITKRRIKMLEFRLQKIKVTNHKQEMLEYRNSQKPVNGYVVLDCSNGDGWWFIFNHSEGRWISLEAFPSRIHTLDAGNYSIAFDDFYRNGKPSNTSEYQTLIVKAGDVIRIEVDYVFKRSEKLSKIAQIKKQQKREQQLWSAVLNKLAGEGLVDIKKDEFNRIDFTLKRKPRINSEYPQELMWWK